MQATPLPLMQSIYNPRTPPGSAQQGLPTNHRVMFSDIAINSTPEPRVNPPFYQQQSLALETSNRFDVPAFNRQLAQDQQEFQGSYRLDNPNRQQPAHSRVGDADRTRSPFQQPSPPIAGTPIGARLLPTSLTFRGAPPIPYGTSVSPLPSAPGNPQLLQQQPPAPLQQQQQHQPPAPLQQQQQQQIPAPRQSTDDFRATDLASALRGSPIAINAETNSEILQATNQRGTAEASLTTKKRRYEYTPEQRNILVDAYNNDIIRGVAECTNQIKGIIEKLGGGLSKDNPKHITKIMIWFRNHEMSLKKKQNRHQGNLPRDSVNIPSVNSGLPNFDPAAIPKGKIYSALLNRKESESLGYALFRHEYWNNWSTTNKARLQGMLADPRDNFKDHKVNAEWDALDEVRRNEYCVTATSLLKRFKSENANIPFMGMMWCQNKKGKPIKTLHSSSLVFHELNGGASEGYCKRAWATAFDKLSNPWMFQQRRTNMRERILRLINNTLAPVQYKSVPWTAINTGSREAPIKFRCLGVSDQLEQRIIVALCKKNKKDSELTLLETYFDSICAAKGSGFVDNPVSDAVIEEEEDEVRGDEDGESNVTDGGSDSEDRMEVGTGDMQGEVGEDGREVGNDDDDEEDSSEEGESEEDADRHGDGEGRREVEDADAQGEVGEDGREVGNDDDDEEDSSEEGESEEDADRDGDGEGRREVEDADVQGEVGEDNDE
ncbi:hypothetical protein BC829DRAFT_423729 [Chytridium lagenaria]|nr:hypothetical protein BC829DRAFT_423729 [Chytridium lagenaria]